MYKDHEHFMPFQIFFRSGCELLMQAPITEYPQQQDFVFLVFNLQTKRHF